MKPFDAEELIARVHALLRRGNLRSQPVLTWGLLSIDPSSRHVTYRTQLVSVTAKEYAVLELLLRNPQKVLSIQTILDQVWSSAESPGNEVVRVHIKELRKKLKQAGAPSDLIKTVYRAGYRLNPLYDNNLAAAPEASLTIPQIAELQSLNQELRSTQAALQQQHRELEQAYQTIAQEEQELQAAKAQLNQILNYANASIVSMRVFADRTWQYDYYSAGSEAVFGYTATELMAGIWWSRIHPEDRKSGLAQAMEAIFVERPVHLEYRFQHKAGSLRWISSDLTSYRDDACDCWRVIAIDMDISDRKRAEAERQQAEAALRGQEEAFRATFNLTNVGMTQADIQTRQLLRVNDAFCTLTGYTAAELLTRTIDDLNHPDDNDRDRETFFNLLEGKTPKYELEKRYRRKNGHTVWVLAIANIIRDTAGQPRRMMAIIQDITERKQAEVAREQAEKTLRESEQQYHQILDATTDMVLVKGPESQIVWANQAFRAYCGMTLEALQGLVNAPCNQPEYTEQYRRDDVFVFTTGQTLDIPEEPITRHDGVVRLFHTVKSPIFDASGQVIRLVAVCRDITDQKQIQASLRQSEERRRLALTFTNTVVWEWELSTESLPESSNADQILAAAVKQMRYQDYSNFSWSDNADQVLELKSVEKAVSYAIWRNYVHPEDIEHLEAIVVAYLQQQQQQPAYEVEYRMVHPDGSIDWVLSKGQAIYAAAGRAVRMVGITMNINDRKQAEIELQQRQALLSSVYQGAAQAIFIIEVTPSGDFRYLDFNQVSEQYVGRTNQEAQGKTPEEVFGPVNGATFRQNYERCVQAGTTITYEDYVELDDRVLCTLTTLSPLRNEQGEIYRIVGTATDITDRKKVEIALYQSEERRRLALDLTNTGIWEWDIATGKVTWSDQIYCLLGLTPGEIEPTYPMWLTCVHPEDVEHVRNIIEVYVQKQRETFYEAEYRVIYPDGSIHWSLSKGHSIIDASGQVVRMVGTTIDITERKLAEQALLNSEQQLQAILDHAPAAIYIMDRQNRHLLANRRYGELCSRTPESLIGKSLHEVWPAAFADAFTANNQTVLETGQLLQIEETAPHPDGPHTYISVKFPLRDATGAIYALCGISTDITDKKQLEAQFYQAQRLESLGTLASGVAHDLNNIFTPILAISQLLRLTLSQLDDQTQDRLKLVEESAKRGVAMVQSILTFARKSVGASVTVELEELLQEVVQIIQQSFPKTIEIRQDWPVANSSKPALGKVLADPTHLHQVLMNLLINARDAMPNGGILTIAAKNDCVDAALARQNLDAQVGNYVVISITDTGTGMEPQVQARIFEPFFTTKAIGQGTGLGLATTLGLVKQHGGFLQVFSEVGQGTEIKVYLPIATGTAAIKPSQQENQPAEWQNGQGKLVMVVDDDPTVQSTTQTLLESHHYTTLIAHDGIEAIVAYAQHQDDIQLVILDVMMPNMGGIPLIQKLKRMNPMVKIIAISGLSSNEESVLAAGANAFLAKPYDLATLLQHARDLSS